MAPAAAILGKGVALAAGWATQHGIVKPIFKQDNMITAVQDAGAVTTKVAFGEAIVALAEQTTDYLHLNDYMQNGHAFVKHGMKFVLYFEILNGLHESLDYYAEHNTKQLSLKGNIDDDSSQLLNRLTLALQDPIFRHGFAYLIFGFSNALITSAAGGAFTEKLIPQVGYPTHSYSEWLNQNYLQQIGKSSSIVVSGINYPSDTLIYPPTLQWTFAKKLVGAFIGTFGSILIKNYADEVVGRDKTSDHDAFYEKMYLAGLRAYFALTPLTTLGTDIGLFLKA